VIRCACAKTGNFGYEVGPAEEPCRRFRGIVGGFGGRELPPVAHPHAAIVLPQIVTDRKILAGRKIRCLSSADRPVTHQRTQNEWGSSELVEPGGARAAIRISRLAGSSPVPSQRRWPRTAGSGRCWTDGIAAWV
jgi:hypothetical protein